MNTATMTRRLRPWLVSLLLLAAGPYALSQDTARTTVIDPPDRVARLGYIEGDVSLLPAGASAGSEAPSEGSAASAEAPPDGWMEAALNRPLTSGDTLWVGSDARAQLQTGSSDIYLDHDTGFGFILLDDDVMQMSLTEGAATVRVRRLAEHETIQVETPTAGIVLRRPGEYHLMIAADDRTIVKTRSGEAQVEDGQQSYTVGAGQTGTFSGPDGSPGSFATLAPRNAFETWANERDQRGEHSRSASHVSTDVIGYEDLDEHGEWLDEPEYGQVWRPLHAASDWAPYRYGQWTWIRPWGWTWVDDARWGFAPFHYGRWAQIRNRWCWVPGPRHLRPVYAPALVSWTGGPSLSVVIGLGSGVGWFPLAPHEIYRPWYRHTPRYVRRVNHANTFIDRARTRDFHTRRQPPHRHQYGRMPGAVTVVPRERFSGHPVATHRVTVNDRELRQWRENRRAPTFMPDRDRHVTADTARDPPPARTPHRGTTPHVRQRGDDRPAGTAWRGTRTAGPGHADDRRTTDPRTDRPRSGPPKVGGDFYTTRARSAESARAGTWRTTPRDDASPTGRPQNHRARERLDILPAGNGEAAVRRFGTSGERTPAASATGRQAGGHRYAGGGERNPAASATPRRGTSATTQAGAAERRSAGPRRASRTPAYSESSRSSLRSSPRPSTPRSSTPRSSPHRATSGRYAPSPSTSSQSAPNGFAPSRSSPPRRMDQNQGPRQSPPSRSAPPRSAPRSMLENRPRADRPGAPAARSGSSLRRHKD